jgi:predicted AAA+ superfamily ATPase
MHIRRHIFRELAAQIGTGKISILMGARQVGKTTLLKQLEKFAEKQNLKTKFFDFEDPRILAEFNKSHKEIFDYLLSLRVDVLFFDEFHYVDNISKIFKALYDHPTKIDIFASGSSTLEMHKHLEESMAGRKYSYKIFPFNFSESCSRLKFEDYLIWGGLPAVVLAKSDKKRLANLDEILTTYVNKDIKSLVKEENISAFNHLIKLLAFNQNQIQDYSSLAGDIRVDIRTVERYIEILAGTYVLYKLDSFSGNLSNELKKSKKFYFYDNGIRNLLINNLGAIMARDDKGCLYESYVFNYLKSQLLANMELRFWRTKDKKEIDFVLLKNQKPYLIEVKSKLNRASTPKHIDNFIKHYPETRAAFVVNENIEDVLINRGKEIHFIKLENLEKHKLLNQILGSVG